MRKIVQIAGGSRNDASVSLFALCDDGTGWYRKSITYLENEEKYDPDLRWKQMAPVPQE